MVSPGEMAPWAKRSMGSALKAAAPAIVLDVLERKLRRVSDRETEIILFMAFRFFSDAQIDRRYSPRIGVWA